MSTHHFIAALLIILGACQFDASVPAMADEDSGPSGDRNETGVIGPGLALSFDGIDDFVRLDRTVAEDFTLEAWIRTTASRDGNTFYHGLGLIYADVSGGRNDFGTAILNNHFCFGIGPSDVAIESTTIVTTGEWIHVAAVRTMATGEIRLLINGVEEGRIDGLSLLPLDASATINIGGNTIDGRYFDGTIDEVRIWNVARTNLEIFDAMSSSLSGSEAGLVGYWRFDNDSDQALDLTVSQNHGMLGGGDLSRAPTHVLSDAPLQ